MEEERLALLRSAVGSPYVGDIDRGGRRGPAQGEPVMGAERERGEATAVHVGIFGGQGVQLRG